MSSLKILRINRSFYERVGGVINSHMKKLWLKIRFLFNSLFKKKTKEKDKIYPLY